MADASKAQDIADVVPGVSASAAGPRAYRPQTPLSEASPRRQLSFEPAGSKQPSPPSSTLPEPPITGDETDAKKAAGEQEMQKLRDDMRKMSDDMRALMAKTAIQDKVIQDWEIWHREQEENREQEEYQEQNEDAEDWEW